MENSGFEKLKNREPFVAGKFYPGTKGSLKKELSELFSAAKKTEKPQKPPQALISPHAGYVFSGKVAASAFNQIPENTTYKRVFVLASSHQFLFGGVAVFISGNYKTPLGKIKVDTELARELIESDEIFRDYNEAHEHEHSLEVQLPFLQYKLKNKFLLVPVILGTNNPADAEKIAKALAPYFTPENLFVISTDFSHYPEYNDAIKNDFKTAEAICSNNPKKLLKVLDENKRKKISHLATSLCGWTSVLTLLYLTQNKNLEYIKIDYQNSGDAEMYGDKDRVVGYWAIAVYDKGKPFFVSEEEQKELLDKARNSIIHFLETGKRSSPEPPATSGILKQCAGVFVSVYVKNELRGCIGNFAKDETLNDLVQRMATSAACDYRFENLQKDELDNLEIEISVLAPLKKIKSVDEIELGKHGIYIKKGLNSGTFLPQVAQKTGWTLEEFLGHCARDKAGLGWDGWKTAELFTYEAEVFRG
ncbi:AmmeMemoRadiSam system protein B [Mariniphaga sp.]|uniref:AmmeMemoRadiSam system protein B n=1 Tax=Mariniphaga sp. TaxID=1954475 RepID=UPI00356B3EFF